jgi:hypothetical protein
MIKFATTTMPPKPKTSRVVTVSLLLAFLLVCMAVGQLFSFEKFTPLIESFNLPGGNGTGMLVAGLVVVCEVFALPFLLRMRVSPLMRATSMVCGWMVAAIWLILALWLNMTVNMVSTVGLFGVKIPLVVGWWAVFYAVAIGILAGWASWGMWPLRAFRQPRSK